MLEQAGYLAIYGERDFTVLSSQNCLLALIFYIVISILFLAMYVHYLLHSQYGYTI